MKVVCVESDSRLAALVAHFKIQPPMLLAAGVECAAALCASAPTLEVLVDGQDVSALPTQHSAFVAASTWPDV